MLFGAAMKPATHNFHIPLPDDLHARLRKEAERRGVPATEIARDAIRAALSKEEREALEAAIESYARWFV